MGHLGKKPILHAWYFVFAALLFNYMGQGIFALQHPEAKYLLFGMVQHQAPYLYIPFLVLTVLATIIASQSIISGAFSVVYQGITTRIMPLLKVSYTSSQMKAQIYIPFVNWVLMCAVIFMMLTFQKSENLAAAYGMAVTGSMTITSLMMILVFSHIRKVKWKLPIAVMVSCIAFAYFIATLSKIPHGAYWSLILAAIPFTAILIWTKGQQRLYDALRPLELKTFLISYEQIYRNGKNHRRYGPVLLPRLPDDFTLYRPHHLPQQHHLRTEYPDFHHPDRGALRGHGASETGPGAGSRGLRGSGRLPGNPRYRSVCSKQHGIQEKVIFYGVEDIVTRNPIWQMFSLIKRVTPNFVQFSKLPPSRLQGIVTRVEM